MPAPWYANSGLKENKKHDRHTRSSPSVATALRLGTAGSTAKKATSEKLVCNQHMINTLQYITVMIRSTPLSNIP